MNTPFVRIITVAFAAAMLAASAVSAQEYRKDQVQDRVQDRVQNTNQRINQEYRKGNISRCEARDEHTDGNPSRGEQAQINQQENSLNRQITRESR